MFVEEVLGEAGMVRLKERLATQDRLSVAQRRAISSEVMESHAPAAALDQVIDLPGWTQDVVDGVTANYRADVGEIAVLPGVEFVLP